MNRVFVFIILAVILAILILFACQSGNTAPPARFPWVTQTQVRPDNTQVQEPQSQAPSRNTQRPLPATPTLTATPKPTSTRTPTPTATPIPLPQVNVFIRSCDTGIDIFNGLGEVTNAYVLVQNLGDVDATHLWVAMKASDEEKNHPAKSYQFEVLPGGYEIALKLTVDTKNGTDTSIDVLVTSDEGVNIIASEESCKQRRTDKSVLDALGELFEVRKIEE